MLLLELVRVCVWNLRWGTMCGCVWFQLAGAEPHTVYPLYYLFSSSVCVSVSLCICVVISTYTLDKWQIRGVDVHASFTLCYLLLWVHLRLTNTAHRQVTLCTASSSLTRSHLHIINPHMETLLHGHQRQQRPSLKIQSIVRLAASHIVLMMTTCPWKLSLSRLSYLMCLTLTCQTCRRLYPDDATNLEWERGTFSQ